MHVFDNDDDNTNSNQRNVYCITKRAVRLTIHFTHFESFVAKHEYEMMSC